mmetsp:Transcript_6496/g.26310  ORF Transcript_6496/g.26310 Transcript_6496/m.26310 type:complete len:428 (+) Transcript_6496:2323-3606(+)
MSTTRSSGLLRKSARSSTNRKSVLMSRSCTSSIMTCDTPSSDGSRIRRRSKTPVVTNSTDAPSSRGEVPWRRTEKPTELPHFSPRSFATRCATETAAIRRGCVTTTRVSGPAPFLIASSRMYCGHCVLLPLPVPPETTTTWFVRSASTSASLILTMGRFRRTSRIFASRDSGSASAAAASAASSSRNFSVRNAERAKRASFSSSSEDARAEASRESSSDKLAVARAVFRRRYPPSTASPKAPSKNSEASSVSFPFPSTRFMASRSASRQAAMRLSWSSGVPMALMSASMASSGRGGTRSDAAEPPGELFTTDIKAACLSSPMVSASVWTMSPYAASSASPFEPPTPLAVRLLPPSTYAVTVATHFEPLGAYVVLGREPLTSSKSNRPSSAPRFNLAFFWSLTILPTLIGFFGSIAFPVTIRTASNMS